MVRTTSTVLNQMVALGNFIREAFSLFPSPVKAAYFTAFSILIFFGILKLFNN